jgi:hypothetical protein
LAEAFTRPHFAGVIAAVNKVVSEKPLNFYQRRPVRNSSSLMGHKIPENNTSCFRNVGYFIREFSK